MKRIKLSWHLTTIVVFSYLESFVNIFKYSYFLLDKRKLSFIVLKVCGKLAKYSSPYRVGNSLGWAQLSGLGN